MVVHYVANLAILNLSIEVSNSDYKDGAIYSDHGTRSIADCVHLRPVGSDALNKSTGLDLRRTTPPITEIVDFLIGVAGKNSVTVRDSDLRDSRIRSRWRNCYRAFPGRRKGCMI